jgi:hypothetical protein
MRAEPPRDLRALGATLPEIVRERAGLYLRPPWHCPRE